MLSLAFYLSAPSDIISLFSNLYYLFDNRIFSSKKKTLNFWYWQKLENILYTS